VASDILSDVEGGILPPGNPPAVRRFPDYRPKLLEQQPKNGTVLAFGPAQSLGVVMEDNAGGNPVAACVSRLKLLLRNNERTHVRCYD
jgi:hypothetical protein